ncbi:DnaJ domain or J-domain containing protein [Metarhizium album ARSEF 1941]|uniref:DnaJ domain or J-domain containing protein n=1 Tax=Metarhizium album (strain ARSEF 1941) TaxID=1081103 RepID=A0A0B2WTR8_METAS|nr:DnaJ domain or J-domain containing protein [Metarhizium album ARSEF 1941]KHN96310.1 DnaJ domain or J-domain containing protein [Metarhizium album ARSEF 1941]
MKIAHLSLGLLSLLTPLTAAWSKEGKATYREIFRLRHEISAYEPNPDSTFYDILGVPPTASADDINKALRKKTVALHPDKVVQRLKAKHLKKAGGKGKKSSVKPPTAAEIKAAVKQASERQARLSLIGNILKGPSKDRYDHFLSNGFPLWKGTDYYYNRYRPGLGTVMVGLFVIGGGAIHYLILYMSWKRQREFVERYVKFARDTAWGGSLGIPNLEPRVPPSATASDDETPPPVPQNRKERRMQEKEAKREGCRGRAKKTTKKTPNASRDDSAGPTGVRRRVVAQNGKILLVDSLGDVYLEEEDDEGNVNEYLLDPNELVQPSFKDTAVVRLPMHIFDLTVGRFIGNNDAIPDTQTAGAEEVVDASQQTSGSESAGDDFELLDKSTDSLGKAKSSGMDKSGKSSKRRNKKR